MCFDVLYKIIPHDTSVSTVFPNKKFRSLVSMYTDQITSIIPLNPADIIKIRNMSNDDKMEIILALNGTMTSLIDVINL